MVRLGVDENGDTEKITPVGMDEKFSTEKITKAAVHENG